MSAADPAAPRQSRQARLWNFMVELWGVLRRPSSVFSLGLLVFAGFVAGVIFWGGFNTALELTNTETFCTGCHEMRDNVFAELKSTIQFTNRSGVRASCPDCHVPHNWHPGKIRRPSARTGAARMGALQGQRLPGMPQLPQHRIDGHHQAVAARLGGPPALPVHG
jgi:hypothetical protein